MAMTLESCLVAAIVAASIAISNSDTPALFVFGDSLNDVGNNNYLTNAPKANFPPNGIDFPGDIPTGRFSNGIIGIDFIAKFLRFPGSPPPYLSLTRVYFLFRKGVNFASGGSGILDTTGPGTISLREQILYFKSVSRNLGAILGAQAANASISKSIFYISDGSNDMFAYYYATIGSQNRTQDDQFIKTLIDNLKTHLMSLYKLGARKFGILGTASIGCIPVVRSVTPGGLCVETLNSLSLRFKNATRDLLHDLSRNMTGMKYSFIDAYEMTKQIIVDSLQYGITELKTACCGSGKFNGEAPCTPNATLCSNRAQYYFWDGYHPTQIISKLTAKMSFSGSLYTTPLNIMQLADY